MHLQLTNRLFRSSRLRLLAILGGHGGRDWPVVGNWPRLGSGHLTLRGRRGVAAANVPRGSARPRPPLHSLDTWGVTLLGDESVHHLNGLKDDNRIENLELWVRPQPSGIRAADALAWAREIVAR